MTEPSSILTITLAVEPKDVGWRLDRWLAHQLPEYSRSEIQRWIKAGLVEVEGSYARPSQATASGQAISVQPPPPVETSLIPEPIALEIVYEDGDLLVINKPAGLVVHPAPGHRSGTLVNAILHHVPEIQGVGGVRRPGIVHRLDKETSGLIVVAKNDGAHRALQEQFKSRAAHKEYLVLVEGRLLPPQGRINVPLGRHPVHRKRQAVLLPDPHSGLSPGRPALTTYTTLANYAARTAAGHANFTLVNAVLHTGRTHQIRVHFAWLNHPIVGDRVYGLRKQRLPLDRQFLHAHKLGIRLPGSDLAQEFTTPLPSDLQGLLDRLAQE